MLISTTLLGLNKDGIFRFSGNLIHVNELRLLEAENAVTAEVVEKMDVHAVCAFIKLFLADLNEPLLGYDLSEFILDMRQPELSIFAEKGAHKEGG